MKKLFLLVGLVVLLSANAIAKTNYSSTTWTYSGILKTTDPNAVCNNGEQATYVVKAGSTNKWAVILYGGAGSSSADQYKNQGSSTKRPGGNHSFTTGPEIDLKEKGYNMVFIHSCTNDIYQGNHYNVIDGKEVPFRGRVVVEDVIRALYDELNNADDVIFAGYSAGANGIGFHAPLIGEFDNVRVIIDSFWYDKANLDYVRPLMLKPEQRNKHSFQFRSSNELCDGNFVSCFPSRENFQKNGIEDVFLIWNIGDGYSHAPDRSAVMKATKSDIDYYGAGYSIRADEREIRGLGRGWGHVMAFNDNTYKKKYFKMSLQEALNNWIDKKGDAIVIDYYNTQTTADPIISSPLFDGRYSFTISRYHDDEDWQELGSGFIQIKNGIMTVAKDGRTLDTGSIDLYDTFEGQIDKQGNIISSLKINVLTGKTRLFLVDLTGSIDTKLQGEWDDYFDVVLKLGEKESAKSDKKIITTVKPTELFAAVKPTELFATIETSDAFDGSYSFKLSLLHSMSGNSKRIGNGYIEINNGIMTVAKDGRSIVNGSEDLYDSFEGRIDKKGNIISVLEIPHQCGTTNMTLIDLDLRGNIKRQLKHKCGEYLGVDFEVVLKLGEKE